MRTLSLLLVSLVALLGCGAESPSNSPPPVDGGADVRPPTTDTSTVIVHYPDVPFDPAGGEFTRGRCVFSGGINLTVTESTPTKLPRVPWANVRAAFPRDGTWSVELRCLPGAFGVEVRADGTVVGGPGRSFPVLDESQGRLYTVVSPVGTARRSAGSVELMVMFETRDGMNQPLAPTTVRVEATR